MASEGIAFRNVLYATDFSRPSQMALPYALSIARKYGSTLFVVTVVSVPPFPSAPPTQTTRALAAQGVREARAAMDRLEPLCKGAAHQMMVCKGDVWTELEKVIQDKKIDLLVVGTHGRTGVSKVLMGSVAEKVFRRASCPVLTAGPEISGEPDSVADIHTILYPTDFTPDSLGAASYVVSLAREHQARLYLFHVTGSEVDAEEEASLLARLRSLVPPEAGLWCEPKAFVASGSVADEICRLAEELGVDLIVLGPKRKPIVPGATHLPMATAYRVVSHANCPVLTVRGSATDAHQHPDC